MYFCLRNYLIAKQAQNIILRNTYDEDEPNYTGKLYPITKKRKKHEGLLHIMDLGCWEADG